jgi:hypothetical protein
VYGIGTFADETLGARSRIPRPVRKHQRPRRPLVAHATCYSRYHLRMAAITSPRLFHQAEANLSVSRSGLNTAIPEYDNACGVWWGLDITLYLRNGVIKGMDRIGYLIHSSSLHTAHRLGIMHPSLYTSTSPTLPNLQPSVLSSPTISPCL